MGVIYEQPLSRDFVIDAATASITRNFFVRDEADEAAVEALVRARTERVFRRLTRTRVRTNRAGPAEWFVTVEYGTPPPGGEALGPTAPPAPVPPNAAGKLGPAFSFDTTGATAHVTQSLKTISKSARVGGDTFGNVANKFTLDNQRAIGLSRDRVDGCDKYVPQFQWGLEVHRANCTGRYLLTLAALTGTTNSTPFVGFPTGCVLYLGASGRFTFDDRWTISHKFASLPLERNVRVSDAIVVPEKRGWDYLWVGYTPQQVGNQILQVPEAAYVERIYHEGHFWLLEVGGVNPRDALIALAGPGGGNAGPGGHVRRRRRLFVGAPVGAVLIDADGPRRGVVAGDVFVGMEE